MQRSTLARRTVLSAIGTGLTAGLLGTGAIAKRRGGSQYALEQGDSCTPVRPIGGIQPVEMFYEYQLPVEYISNANGATVGESAMYSSAGTREWQRARTSIVFLYRGPRGLSLVVVHGSTRAPDAGAVTFRISGLPEDGEWIVKDDLYREPDTGEIAASNYDRWNVDGNEHHVDWTWGSAGTDGGVFGDLGDGFEVVIHPAFNEAAPLYNEHYEGTVTDWEFLSGSTDAPERVSLSLDEPIRIKTGGCEGDTASGRTGQQTGQQQKERQGQQDQKERQTEKRQEEKRQEKQEERQEDQEERQEEGKEKQEERQEKRQEEQEEQREEPKEKQEEQQEEGKEKQEERQEEQEKREKKREERQEEQEKREKKREERQEDQEEQREERKEKQEERQEEREERREEREEDQEERREEREERREERKDEQEERREDDDDEDEDD